jgi:hypothetical protein
MSPISLGAQRVDWKSIPTMRTPLCRLPMSVRATRIRDVIARDRDLRRGRGHAHLHVIVALAGSPCSAPSLGTGTGRCRSS